MAQQQATLAQALRILQMADDQHLSAFQMQEILMSGFITDICRAAKQDKLGQVDRERMQRVLGLRVRGDVLQSFRLENGDEPPVEELLRLGNYDCILPWLQPNLFPLIQPRPRDMVMVELIQVDPTEPFLSHGPEAEAIEKAEKLGLERPTFVDALLFGIQHPKAQTMGPPITFLHEPIEEGLHSRFVISLEQGDHPGRRMLGANCMGRVCRFAFIRKSD